MIFKMVFLNFDYLLLLSLSLQYQMIKKWGPLKLFNNNNNKIKKIHLLHLSSCLVK